MIFGVMVFFLILESFKKDARYFLTENSLLFF